MKMSLFCIMQQFQHFYFFFIFFCAFTPQRERKEPKKNITVETVETVAKQKNLATYSIESCNTFCNSNPKDYYVKLEGGKSHYIKKII